MAPTKTKFISFKGGSLIRSSLVKIQPGLAIRLEDIMKREKEYVLVMQKKESETFTVTGVDEVEGFKFVDVQIFAREDPREFLMIISSGFPKGSTMLWQSGICKPKDVDFVKHNLKEEGCIWEGIFKFKNDVNLNQLSKDITDLDKKSIIASVEFVDIPLES